VTDGCKRGRGVLQIRMIASIAWPPETKHPTLEEASGH